MPLLTRMVGTPLAIDIESGAVARLAPLLQDRRISSGGHVAIVNRGPTTFDDRAVLKIAGGAGETLAAVARRLLEGAD